jgi:methyl-accepting chemotaxis protein
MTNSSGLSRPGRDRAGGEPAPAGDAAARRPSFFAFPLRRQDDELARCRAELERYRTALDEIDRVCAAAARGDLETRVLGVEGDDRLGGVARSVNHLLDLTDAYVRESTGALQAASEGRFYRRFLTRGMLGSFGHGAAVTNRASAEMERKTDALEEAKRQRLALAADFERTVLEVVEAVASASAEATAAAHSLTEAAADALSQSASTSESAASVVREMAAAALASRRVAESVDDIEHQVRRAGSATREAMHGVEAAGGSIGDLAGASETINEVVKLIEGIAVQTRLLALNATIEAAHAGAAGKGFGVVAGEVRNLATRTASATVDISRQVTAIQSITGVASTAMGTLVESVAELSSLVGAAVQRQRTATEEIDAGIRRASDEADQAATRIGAVSDAAQHTSSAAAQMLATADELTRMATRLQGAVSNFLLEVRRDT